jgi:predicted Zn-dependent protease
MVEKNTQRAVDLRKSLMPANWQDDAKRLNQFAAWCLDSGVNLDEADVTVLKAVELAKTDAERGRYLATATEIALKRGDANAAVERGKQALALDPANEDTVDLVARAEAALAGKAE